MRRHGVMVLAMTVIFVLSASMGVAQTESNESDEGNLVINVVLPIALAYIMFSLGIGLKVSDFSSILDNPKAFAVGLTNQMVLLPIVAFTISHGLELTGEMAVGLMILACCPGGVTSNIISRISGGDTALSISYTAVVSLVSVLTLPIIVGMSMSHFMGSDAPNIGILSLGLTMFLLTTVPVVSGMFVRHFLKNSADKMEKIGNNIASLLFVVIVFAAIASEFDTLVDNMSSLGPAVFILNVMMLAIGLGSSNYFDLNEEQSLTVSIESGIQNATVGITIGGLIMAPEAGASLSLLSLPSGVYGVVMYLVIIPFLFWRSNRSTS